MGRARNGARTRRESGRCPALNAGRRNRWVVGSVSGESSDLRWRPRRGQPPDRARRAVHRAARARRRGGRVSRRAGDCRGRARPNGSAAGRQHDGARVRSERRDFAGAETLYRRALAVVETAYGSEDPRVAGPLANLAALYRRWDRWDNAAPLYLRLAGVFEQVLGADDFHVAMTFDHVAEAYAGQGRYAEAEHFYGRVLAILAPRLGSDHPIVQQVLAKQARARHDLELSGARKG